ncbi:hypothetical protein LSTR_LSTR013099 [Laodelphax striatellus]|uniref:Uncharacterized protein n=1 Tax=Laodelphax striatellus TaxID=195883 RepID=A0A482XLN1_LAOST|nr:hypothetical protein LSTR_LSTR013099 [Laodelphax striatellus]
MAMARKKRMEGTFRFLDSGGGELRERRRKRRRRRGGGRRRRRRKRIPYEKKRERQTSERLYTNKHEWILMQGNIGTIGISHYAQESLGDVVFAQLPEVGTLRRIMVEHNEGKTLDLKMKFHYDDFRRVGAETRHYFYAPLENTSFSLGLVLPHSYGNYWIKAGDEIRKTYQMGWLFKVEIEKKEELEELMNEEEYSKFLKTDADH